MNKLNIINFLDTDWENDYKRPHMEALGKYTNLLSIESPVTLDIPLRRPLLFLDWLKRGRFLRQITPTLLVYKPVALVPYSISLRLPWFKTANRAVMKASLRNVIKRLGMSDNILMLPHPAQECVIGMLNEQCICYDVYDEHSESRVTSSKIKKLVKGVELKILKKADIVFTSARNLFEIKKLINPNTHFVPNAADVKFFMKTMDTDTTIPSDMQKIPEPRIGLIGNINDIVDMDLLVYMAEQKPDWSIILIGKINGSSRFLNSQSLFRCKEISNIYLMGFRNYETLPSYQKGLNVCLLPYLINKYTVNVYPNKVHQYLAGGKPVVSTDLPEMRPFAEVVDIAKNHDEFLNNVEKAFKNDNAVLLEKRIEVARENSVEKRAELKVQLLKEVLNGKS